MSDRGTSVLSSVGATIATLFADLVRLVRDAVAGGLGAIERWLVDEKHAGYGFAVTRILIGLTGLGLLAANFTTRLYTFGSGSVWNGEAAAPRSDFPNIWIFSAFNRMATNDALFTFAYLVLAALAVAVVLGWRKRFVMPVYFIGWVSFIEMNDGVGDQGDNMYRITLLMLLFTDCARHWSLDARRLERRGPAGRRVGPLKRFVDGDPLLPAWFLNPVHNLALVSLTAQVSFVYVSGALYKAGGEPWQNGSAVYAPLATERFGTWPLLSDLVSAWDPVLTIAAWGSIILQLSFPFMLMRRPTRIVALVGILSFHVAIAVLMGLPWFSLAMIAVDAVFIRDRTWRGIVDRIGEAWRDARSRSAGDGADARGRDERDATTDADGDDDVEGLDADAEAREAEAETDSDHREARKAGATGAERKRARSGRRPTPASPSKARRRP